MPNPSQVATTIQSWITEYEYQRALCKADKIFGDWLSRISMYDGDYWVSVDIDGKVFDLNLWEEDDGKSSYCTIHPTKVNDEGQLETVGTAFIRMLTMERQSSSLFDN